MKHYLLRNYIMRQC